MEEYLHNAKTFFDENNFRKMYSIHNRWGLICIKACLIMFIMLFLMALFYWNDLRRLILPLPSITILLTLFALFRFYYYYRISRKFAFDNKVINTVIDFKFYNHHLIINYDEITKFDSSDISYSELYKIVEAKNHFLIMRTKEKIVIIDKQDCTPELISFLQELKKNIGKK